MKSRNGSLNHLYERQNNVMLLTCGRQHCIFIQRYVLQLRKKHNLFDCFPFYVDCSFKNVILITTTRRNNTVFTLMCNLDWTQITEIPGNLHSSITVLIQSSVPTNMLILLLLSLTRQCQQTAWGIFKTKLMNWTQSRNITDLFLFIFSGNTE